MSSTGSSEADAKERGGAHYKDTPPELQHWNAVTALGWDYLVGAATKYLWRLGKKDDPITELDKAIHFLQKKREVVLEQREKLPFGCCPESKPVLYNVPTSRYHVKCAGCDRRFPDFPSEQEAMRDFVGRWRHGKPWLVK